MFTHHLKKAHQTQLHLPKPLFSIQLYPALKTLSKESPHLLILQGLTSYQWWTRGKAFCSIAISSTPSETCGSQQDIFSWPGGKRVIHQPPLLYLWLLMHLSKLAKISANCGIIEPIAIDGVKRLQRLEVEHTKLAPWVLLPPSQVVSFICYFMKIGTWNVGRLNNPIKTRMIRDDIMFSRVNMVRIQESKLNSARTNTLKSFEWGWG